MGQKITSQLVDKQKDDNVKFFLYMFMMKLMGDRIYRRYRGQSL